MGFACPEQGRPKCEGHGIICLNSGLPFLKSVMRGSEQTIYKLNSKTASHLIPIFIMLTSKALLPTLSRPKPSTPQVSYTRPSQVLVFFCSCHEIQSITTLSITPQALHTPSILHLPTTSFVFQMLVSYIALYTFALARQSRSYLLVCYDEALAPCCEHLTATEKSLEVYTRVSSIRPPQVLFCKCSCHTIQSVPTFIITPQGFHTTT